MPTSPPSRVWRPLLAFAALLLSAARGWAGPPFLTDDPVPVDHRHWEFYLFGAGDHADLRDYSVAAPAAELNYGAFPETQLHVVAPLTTAGADGAPTETGYGDTELGVKYRFVHETARRPQAGVFPMAELPTGNSSLGLGNGRAWFRLPVWMQKSRGPWTSYWGGGAVLNSAPGRRDYPFGGWLLQRDLSGKLTLGGEVFAQGADAADDRGYAVLNFGGYYNFTPDVSLLFSAGHSVAGDNHAIWYLAFYSTWGP
ncbi:MAG: transporter [Elusimicrobia bacterium]|nr:transporter [Elusimicrobiota bacterium]